MGSDFCMLVAFVVSMILMVPHVGITAGCVLLVMFCGVAYIRGKRWGRKYFGGEI